MKFKLDNKCFNNIHSILSIFNLCKTLFDIYSDIDTHVNSEWLSYAPLCSDLRLLHFHVTLSL